MPKNIAIFSDGTGNTKSNLTNVRQFYDVLVKDKENKCFYDKGVGSFNLDVLGKAFGAGMNDNILQCYDFLVSHYEQGDRVCLFGFSRGAYTVRSLANFISIFGLVKKNKRRASKGKPGQNGPRTTWQQLHARRAYKVYQNNRELGFAAKKKKIIEKQEMTTCPILCLGVWDTVGALGLPDGFPKTDLDKPAYKRNRHHRVGLTNNIKYVYHALCIDDRRHEFHPVLFKKKPFPDQTVLQVWFPGMHSDVGGGYKPNKKEDGHAKDLSNLSLRWMAGKVPASLGLKPSLFPAGMPKGKMHDSMNDIYHIKKRSVPKGSKLHKSVRSRITGPLSIPNPDREPNKVYRPAALDTQAFKVDYSSKPDYNLEPMYTLV
jgi:hypothetical protein